MLLTLVRFHTIMPMVRIRTIFSAMHFYLTHSIRQKGAYYEHKSLKRIETI